MFALRLSSKAQCSVFAVTSYSILGVVVGYHLEKREYNSISDEINKTDTSTDILRRVG